MEKKPTDKLAGFKGHRFCLALVPAIFVGKDNPTVIRYQLI